jgi:YegS/Rv2252/BmrU family lipid kinase
VTRAVVITNPNASRAAGLGLARALARLARGGLAVEVRATDAPGHGGEIARAAVAEGADLVIAHGGDGTIMDAAGALVGTGRPLGILPAGTGNRLAGNLGIRVSPVAAADVILAGRTRTIDVGRLETEEGRRHFAVAAGCGFDAALMRHTTSARKRAFGVAAYLATGIRLAGRLTRARVRVETPSGTTEAHAVMVLVANCAGIIPFVAPIAATIRPDDGLFDVVLVDAPGLPAAVRVAWRVATGASVREEAVTMLRATRVVVATEPILPVQADGEAAGHTPFRAEILAGGLTVLAPPSR